MNTIVTIAIAVVVFAIAMKILKKVIKAVLVAGFIAVIYYVSTNLEIVTQIMSFI